MSSWNRDYIGDDFGQLGKGRLDHVLCHGLHRRRFAGLGATGAESGHHGQRLVRHRRDQLLRRAPLEHGDDAARPTVDRRADETGIDHPVADIPETQRPELVGREGAVASRGGIDRQLDDRELPGGGAVVSVVITGVVQVTRRQLGDGQGRSSYRGAEARGFGDLVPQQEPPDDFSVALVAFRGAPRP